MRIRSRQFEGRCRWHRAYNPAVDGPPSARAAQSGEERCPRCALLHEIWETSLKLNRLIRSFHPRHDDLRKPAAAPAPDPRQMSFIAE